MQVNIIHNKERKDRFIKLLYEMSEQGITYPIFWDAVIRDNPKEGIREAHFQIVRNAKEKGLKEVLIMEDDIKFTGKGAFDYFLRNKPELYDLYLGGLSGGVVRNGLVADFSGFHLYMVHEQFYDTFLNDVRSDLDIDRSMRYKGGSYFVCSPMVAVQYDGFSDHAKQETDYSEFWKNYTFYDRQGKN